jgi:ABC-type Fe3+ transport system permease subunit
MITKILLTLTVIVAVILFLRMKASLRDHDTTSRRSSASQPAIPGEKEKMFRQGAWIFMIVMGISAIVMVIYELGAQYATVNVHVVNTQTGERVSYQAEHKDVKSNQFTTLEGRTVYLADIERMEVEPE